MSKLGWTIAALLVVGFVLYYNLSDTKGATRALALAGVTEITLTGTSIFGCNGKGIWRTGFTGINIDGERISGAVCTDFTSTEIVYN